MERGAKARVTGEGEAEGYVRLRAMGDIGDQEQPRNSSIVPLANRAAAMWSGVLPPASVMAEEAWDSRRSFAIDSCP